MGKGVNMKFWKTNHKKKTDSDTQKSTLNNTNFSIKAELAKHNGSLEESNIEQHILLSSIVNASEDAIYSIDIDGIIRSWNQGAANIFGYQPYEVVGKSCSLLLPPFIKQEQYPLPNTPPSDPYLRFESERIKKDGKVFPASVTHSPVWDQVGNITGTSVILKDISNFREVDQKLWQTNRMYAFLSGINQMLLRVKDESTLFSEACRIAVEVGKFKMAWIGMEDEISRKVNPVASKGDEKQYLSNVFISTKDIPEGRGPVGRAIRENKYVFSNDIESCENMVPWKKEALKRGYLSVMAFPILKSGKAAGAFTLYSALKNVFDQVEITLLEEVASNISYALENFEKEKIRIRTEEKLKQSEARLREAQLFSRTSNWEVDILNHTFNWSEEFYQLFGISHKIKPSLEAFLSLFHDDDVEYAKLKIEKSLESAKGASFYSRLKCCKDDSGFVYAKWKIVTDEHHRPVRLYGIIQDVSDRKKLERKQIITSNALQKTLDELNNILDSSQDMICSVDSLGCFIKVSAACTDILGYRPDELTGRSVFEFIHPEDHKVIQQVANKSISNFENRYLHKNGSWVPIAWSIKRQPKINITIAVGRNMTDKKQLEKAIEAERQQFYELFLEAPTGMGIYSGPDHVFTMVNPRYLKMIGKGNEIIGKPLHQVLPELQYQGIIQIFDGVFLSGRAYSAREMLVQLDVKGNQVDHWFDFVVQPHRSMDGTIDGVLVFAMEVTEQVQSRLKIEENQKIFRTLFEESGDAIFLVNDYGFLNCNQAAVALLGYSSKEELLDFPLDKGSAFNEVEKNSSLRNALRLMNQSVKQGHHRFECNLIKKDDAKLPVEVMLTTITIEGKKVIYAICRDISERKIAEEKLLQSEIRFRGFFNLAPEAFLVTDLQTKKIISFNHSAVNLFQYSSRKMLQIDVIQLSATYQPDGQSSVDKARKYISRILRGEKLVWEWMIVNARGEEIMCEVRGLTINSADGPQLFTSFVDITERKKSEQALIDLTYRYQLATDSTNTGIWDMDLETNQLIWEDSMYTLCRIDRDTYKSTFDAWFKVIYPDDILKVNASMGLAIESVSNSFNHTFRIFWPDRQIRYIDVNAIIIRDETGKATRVIGSSRDITEQKEAELMKEKIILDFARRNKDLEQFSYIVSHNLRSPVANIIGLSRLLEGAEDSEYDLLSKQLLNSVTRLDNVIRDLNNILKLRQDINEQKEEVNFQEIVDDIKVSINNMVVQNKAEITTDFTVEHMYTIKSYIHSIFFNLITNSIKYRQPDQRPILSITSSFTDYKVILSFTDNGLGIDLEEKGDQVFGLYKRFHPHIQGKGMGLFMVKTQVESLGGQIYIQSEVNKGTTFTVEFERDN